MICESSSCSSVPFSSEIPTQRSTYVWPVKIFLFASQYRLFQESNEGMQPRPAMAETIGYKSCAEQLDNGVPDINTTRFARSSRLRTARPLPFSRSWTVAMHTKIVMSASRAPGVRTKRS